MYGTPASTGVKVRTIGTNRASMIVGPVLFEECMGLGDVALLEEARVFLVEHRWPDAAPDEIGDLTTEHRGERDRRREHPDCSRAGVARGQQTAGEQQRVAWQQGEQQPGLDEDDDQMPGSTAHANSPPSPIQYIRP